MNDSSQNIQNPLARLSAISAAEKVLLVSLKTGFWVGSEGEDGVWIEESAFVAEEEGFQVFTRFTGLAINSKCYRCWIKHSHNHLSIMF